ncbi:MAG: HAMP domain-containing protein [Spirochaetes bacterium]|nr:HAMP domain-containing protein [Spirochaetota bacterium]
MTKISMKSLKVIISLIAIVVITVLTVILVVTSYNVAYSAIEKAYMNQVTNFNKEIERNLVDFYETEIKNASFFAKYPPVIDAARAGRYNEIRPLLAHFFKEKGIYEQIFVSTAELNSRIMVSADGKADGIRWGEIPVYVENARKALKGEIHVSDIGKSPATGLTVLLITVPIMADGRVAGILGLPVDVGPFSRRLVKEVKIGDTGYPFILNYSGMTIAHPNEDNIFKLDANKYDWGQKMMKSPSGSIIYYAWEGKDKFLTFVKNEKYKFYIATSMYLSDINANARSMALIMIVLGLAVIIASAVFMYLFIAKRLAPLDECKDVMASMAQGDLTVRYQGVNRGDEIGDISDAMNRTLDQFEKVVSEIIVSSQNLAQAVEQIASGNQNLSQRTSEQASALEEIASTLEEATATINQNAENADRAQDLTDTGVAQSVEGNQVAMEAVNSIIDMNNSSKKVGEIIAVINEIAFQTNLLALNAAVEAARAGEQGRGFAVVAGEVRNLAQRSGNAAKEIEALIRDTVNKVDRSTDLVNRTGEALSKIAEASKHTAKIITEIAAASQEQKQGMNQINNAITEMDSATQQNASLVEETASASEEMANQAQELLNMVGRFRIGDTVTGEAESMKHRNIHLSFGGKKGKAAAPKAVAAKRSSDGDGNGREKTPDAPSPGAGDEGKLKTILKSEGFEEF